MAGKLKVDELYSDNSYINTTNGVSLNLSQASSYIGIPSGTTAQRPSPVIQGSIRFNTTIGKFEYYNGTEWKNF